MKLIDPSVVVLPQGKGVDGLYRMIEKCARVCYRSENKGKVTSEEFVKGLIKRGHMRPLEFGTITLDYWRVQDPFNDLHYCRRIGNDLLVTNLRWLVERYPDNWESIINDKGHCQLDERNSNRRVALKWHIARGIADEFRTHVSLSSLMESTRYVNYNKKELEFARPWWWYDSNNIILTELSRILLTKAYTEAEESYNMIVKNAVLRPENARNVLPLGIATTLVQCGFPEDWKRFFDQRCSAAAHPDAQEIACEAEEKFNNLTLKPNDNGQGESRD